MSQATATSDRPVHHALLCATLGENVRPAQATSEMGVTALVAAVADASTIGMWRSVPELPGGSEAPTGPWRG
ncbi:MAG TPA: hypothetical protein VMV09_06310 [Candidatus Saccharimonadales bacterium]|nr:hypothetical protein [Candidatus Saccharimonadales bacterium]